MRRNSVRCSVPFHLGLSFVACLSLLFGCSGGGASLNSSQTTAAVPAAPAPSSPASSTGIPHVGHVALVVLENQEEDKILGNPNMPYLTGLAQQNAYASQYYADVHPSLGNYFMLTAGQVVSNDLSFSGEVTADNLFREIIASGKTWKAYLESLPSPGYLDDNAVPYVKTHNPAAYFSDIRENPAQAANMVPFTQLQTDIAAGTLPNFIYIAPNQYNNMHDCEPGGDEGVEPGCNNDQKLSVGDTWMSQNIGPLINSPAFQQDGLLIITWDESWTIDTAHGGGHVLTILLGNNVKKSYISSTFYQHESTLRLVCDALAVPCMANATTAPSMAEFFVGN